MRRRYAGLENPCFRYLEEEEVKNPLLVVEEFFEVTDVELFRQELRLLFTLSFGDSDYSKGKVYDRSRLMCVHQHVTRFIEMAWLLLNDDFLDLLIKEENPLYQDRGMWAETSFIEVRKRLSDEVMKCCRVLEDQEINNVKFVFENVFRYQKLSRWQDELDMALFYSLRTTPMSEECDNGHLSFPMYELLEKLLECMHVIHELKIKGDEGWKVLPLNATVLNKDYSYFPPELMMSLYDRMPNSAN
ncbi:hypothetical protein [Pedobacter steynii]|uniref:Uncharacterized protein n=1 Tax=Pedobacter steynii TaxID=430522 RepID=A0A1D7QER6_9SPHI|nr:hypothetical protein [Pedobacter steynii]AOM77140.1 hypothetical protein BFS30_08145 [Pedobacter steynii]